MDFGCLTATGHCRRCGRLWHPALPFSCAGMAQRPAQPSWARPLGRIDGLSTSHWLVDSRQSGAPRTPSLTCSAHRVQFGCWFGGLQGLGVRWGSFGKGMLPFSELNPAVRLRGGIFRIMWAYAISRRRVVCSHGEKSSGYGKACRGGSSAHA